MSTNLVVIGVIISIFLLGMLFYLSFVHEHQSSQRSTKITQIAEKIRRYQRYLECFPAGYLPKDVRAILIEEIILLLQTQSRLDPKNSRFARLIQDTKTQLESVAAEKDAPPRVGNIRDLKMAKELQLRLKNLFNALVHIGKTRKHHTNTINKNLRILQNIYVETAATVHHSTATQAVEQGKLKLAVHHFNQVIAEYARADSKQFAPKIKEIRNTIQKHETMLKQEHQKQKNKTDQSSALNDEETATKSNGLERMSATDPTEMKKRY